MEKKTLGRDWKKATKLSTRNQDTTQCQFIYESTQGHDIEIKVLRAGPDTYAIETAWYGMLVKTYDMLDTLVLFCQKLFGEGKLTIVLV